jgi:hypothetical protein
MERVRLEKERGRGAYLTSEEGGEGVEGWEY